ncbi:MAG: hypothetical protein HPY79_04530 [Bacteroidales bacterium]|nr:hypothetical protein [Bacteroidales bacterium]
MRAIFFTWLMTIAISVLSQNKNEPLFFKTNPQGSGQKLTIALTKGSKYNHPLLAIWLTTTEGKYIQTLYVSQSIAKGIYEHGKSEQGKWFPGEHRRPAALPYWAFSRGVREADGLYLPTPQHPIPDTYTGATPQNHFVLETRLDKPIQGKAILWLEINQPFDFNDYWHNQKFPDNNQYRTSGQPSLVYAVIVDFNSPIKEYYLNPMGHGHPTGEDGTLFTDLTTLTSALKIVEKIKIQFE